jgi:2-amino-4-hydroxy-6-hydroxymethyldihydropteridine diphosphokinase
LSVSKNIFGDDAVAIALGSNVAGEYRSTRALLEAALARFPSYGMDVIAVSGFWRSEAWPNPSDPPFLNAVAVVDTALDPLRIMQRLHELEAAFGRRRAAENGPRTLDLDLIAFGRAVIDTPALVVPHPRAHLRRFVMGPLAEIRPAWRHPTVGETAADLAAAAPVGLDATPI